MRQLMERTLHWTAAAVAISLILLFEDCVLWSIPRLIDAATQPLLQMECSQIKPGQDRKQVMRIMHRWLKPETESEHFKTGDKPEHTMEFGACRVEFDPSKDEVKSAKYAYNDYGEFGPVIQ